MTQRLISDAAELLVFLRERQLMLVTAESCTGGMIAGTLVSEPVAVAMAEGALRNSRADIAVSVTGVAGPGGGTDTKPVGLVHIACARRGKDTVHQRHLFADRGRGWIRQETVAQAFRIMAQQARI